MINDVSNRADAVEHAFGARTMIRQGVLLLAMGFLLSAHNSVFAATDPFIERNGVLTVEVESGESEGGWSFHKEIYGHTGTGYLVWEGNNNYAKSQAPRGNPIRYHFTITTPGNYELRWRTRNTVGLQATEHNDSWVRFPTGKNISGQHFIDGWTKAYMGQVAQWSWGAFTVDNDAKFIRQYFDAGDHIIDISGRSNGHGLDRFVLFHYESVDFISSEFEALPESPRASQAQQAAHSYTGNSCVAGNLSLSASTALSTTAPDLAGQTIQDIVINGSPDQALLKFDIPRGAISSSAMLKLATSTPEKLQATVYLGSHNNWNAATSQQDLPYPSILLGTLNDASARNSIATLSINSSMLSGERVTIIVNAESGRTQRLHGLGSRLEPRLEMQLASDFCNTHNQRRTGPYDPESSDGESGVGDTAGSGDNSSPDDTSGTGDASGSDDTSGTGDASGSGDTSGTGDTSGSGDTSGTGDAFGSGDTSGTGDASGSGDTSGSSGQPNNDDSGIEGFPVPIENADTPSSDNDEVKRKTRKSGGSLSIWALLALATFTPKSRIRFRQLTSTKRLSVTGRRKRQQ